MGLALGSFATTAGLRWAQGETAVAGRSRCDGCGMALGFGATIPLISYVRVRGACSACGSRIDPAHPVGEVAGATVILSAALVAPPARAGVIAALGLVLVAAAAVDWGSRRLPDLLTGLAALLCLALAATDGPMRLAEGVAASVTSCAVLLGLRWTRSRRSLDPGLGLGDVKLVAGLALWIGADTAWALAGAALAGLAMMALVRPADGRMPFGPALAAMGFAVGVLKEAQSWPTML